jgi:hypothetical protein
MSNCCNTNRLIQRSTANLQRVDSVCLTHSGKQVRLSPFHDLFNDAFSTDKDIVSNGSTIGKFINQSFPCAEAPRYADVWWNGGKAPSILNLGTRWKWVVSFALRPTCPRYPLDRGLVGAQSLSGRNEEKNYCLCRESNSVQQVSRYYGSIDWADPSRLMLGLCLKNELERMWKEAVVLHDDVGLLGSNVVWTCR